MAYRSQYVYTSLGSSKFRSLYKIQQVGRAKYTSLSDYVNVGTIKVRSIELKVDAGYAFINWVYDPDNKRAIGTFSYPLYDNAQFELNATDQIKATNQVPIINPQTIEYIT